ncbi:anti-sigma factor family protein [Paenibacillus ginsengihumi]|uniref:anti-sigma factor family protein n=1 Tax=Paenibacillus ginsengihumi TaxID=431596 RepID=UPI0003757DDC|nr:hypothetical protein [Paenibacillus ginsengihumi]
MNSMHPDERQLQRFLNNQVSELEWKRLRKHLNSCPGCFAKLRDFLKLEMLLDDMPLCKAPDGLTEQIMEAIQSGPAGASEGAPSGEEQRSERSASGLSRRELSNGLVAAAATWLFVSTGLLGRLLSFDANGIGTGIRQSAEQLAYLIESVSRQLLL